MESPTKSKPLAAAVVGIRLGSTTLTLAINRLSEGLESSRPTVVASDTGERSIPTVVAWSNGEWVIGDAAKHQAAKNPKNTFVNLLKLLGKKADDDSILKFCKGIQTLGDINNNNALLLQPINISTLENDGQPMNPTILLSFLLKKMKEIAEENVGGKVGPCIFTVPNDLDDDSISEVIKAGGLAGFDVFQVIRESVAICVAYKLDINSNQQSENEQLLNVLKKMKLNDASLPSPPTNGGAAATTSLSNDNDQHYLKCNHSQHSTNVMIVDIGGSDMSATILNIDNGIMNIIASESSKELSGSLMVEEVVKFAAMFFQRKNGGLDPRESKRSVTRLRQTCEGTLRFLSNAAQADIEVESLFEGCDLRARISRARFEDLCDWNVLNKTIDRLLISDIIKNKHITKDNIDHVLLAGGAARVPKILSKLNFMFPTSNVSMKEMPDEAGALGAAMQASRLVCNHLQSPQDAGAFMRDYKKSKNKFHKLIPQKTSMNCLSHSLGIMLDSDSKIINTIIKKGSILPIYSQCSLFLYNDINFNAKANNNGELSIHLIESEEENNKIVTFNFNTLNKNANYNVILYTCIEMNGKIDIKIRLLKNDNNTNIKDEINNVMIEHKKESNSGSEISISIPAPN